MTIKEINSGMLKELAKLEDERQNSQTNKCRQLWGELSTRVDKVVSSTDFRHTAMASMDLNSFVQCHKDELTDRQVAYANKFIEPYRSFYGKILKEVESRDIVTDFIQLHNRLSICFGRAAFGEACGLLDQYLSLREKAIAEGRNRKGMSPSQRQNMEAIVASSNPVLSKVRFLLRQKQAGRLPEPDELTADRFSSLVKEHEAIMDKVTDMAVSTYMEWVDMTVNVLSETNTDQTLDEDGVISLIREKTFECCDGCPYGSTPACPGNLEKCLSPRCFEQIKLAWLIGNSRLSKAVMEHNTLAGANHETQ